MEISVAFIAVAMGVFIFFIIRTLHYLNASLKQSNEVLAEVAVKMNDFSKEAKELVHSANKIMDDVQDKLQSLDPIFEIPNRISAIADEVASSVKQAVAAATDNLNRDEDLVAKIAAAIWSGYKLAADLRSRFERRKPKPGG